jgi:hypothetical protein
MKNRKDLPIGMGIKTESMIHELEIYLQINGHDLIRKMIENLDDPAIRNEFTEYNRVNNIKRIERSSRIRGFKFKEKEIEDFIKMQWKCRIKGLSTFIKQLIYFYYEKYIGKIN